MKAGVGVPGGSEVIDADEDSLLAAVYGRRQECFVLFMDGLGAMLLYNAMNGLRLSSLGVCWSSRMTLQLGSLDVDVWWREDELPLPMSADGSQANKRNTETAEVQLKTAANIRRWISLH
jgi:hypothetical protein